MSNVSNLFASFKRAVFVTCDLLGKDYHPSFDFLFEDGDHGGTLVTVQYGDGYINYLRMPSISAEDILSFCISFAIRSCLPSEVIDVRANFYDPSMYSVGDDE